MRERLQDFVSGVRDKVAIVTRTAGKKTEELETYFKMLSLAVRLLGMKLSALADNTITYRYGRGGYDTIIWTATFRPLGRVDPHLTKLGL